MNQEYIKRKDISKFANKIKGNFAPIHIDVIDAIVYYLNENIPAADVEPVRHGKWEYNKHQAPYEKSYFCSECAEGESDYGRDNYCQKCGAKMN